LEKDKNHLLDVTADTLDLNVKLKNENEVLIEKENKSFSNLIKTDATNALYRIGATQMMNALKASIIALLQTTGKDNRTVQTIADLLDSDIGLAILSCMCGYSIEHFVDDSEMASKFAAELRVHGMSIAGNKAFETLFELLSSSVVPIITKAKEEETLSTSESQ